ncbi:hypothetical protein QBC41DRAFT_327143 [Cercophora samala]|uniref:Secreted protein n=1 Tax=Cercophora samala TaxID=330535 RepID=A0AA39Z7V7_9PEZI|nr:hypothetical protein QBC41DRAFT_327143 [Cercophora samala]
MARSYPDVVTSKLMVVTLIFQVNFAAAKRACCHDGVCQTSACSIAQVLIETGETWAKHAWRTPHIPLSHIFLLGRHRIGIGHYKPPSCKQVSTSVRHLLSGRNDGRQHQHGEFFRHLRCFVPMFQCAQRQACALQSVMQSRSRKWKILALAVTPLAA